MPTYSYACTSCGKNFDIHQSFDEDSLTVCPECSGKLRKLFSSVGVVFKGSGFYRTDSRAGNLPGKPAAGSPNTTAEKGSQPPSTPPNGESTSGSNSSSSSSTSPASSSTSASPSSSAKAAVS